MSNENMNGDIIGMIYLDGQYEEMTVNEDITNVKLYNLIADQEWELDTVFGSERINRINLEAMADQLEIREA